MDIPLILSKVFSFLDLNEKLQMRLVCKDWYSFVNDFEQKLELCIYETLVPYKLKWSGTGGYVKDAIKVRSSKLDFKDPFLRNLRKLYLYSLETDEYLDCLDNLSTLDELVFAQCQYEKTSSNFQLNLPNLKTLNLGRMGPGLILNAPKLERLETYLFHCSTSGYVDRRELRLIHPDSIQTIKCHHVYNKSYFKFWNLRRLVIEDFGFAIYFPPFLNLEDLPKLQVVELFSNRHEFSEMIDHLSRGKNVANFVKNLKSQRSALGRNDLQILVNGFRDPELVFLYAGFPEFKRESDFEEIKNNLDKMVGNFELHIEVDYRFLLRCYPTNEQRKQFSSKFKKISKIETTGVVDEEEFTEFLNDCGAFSTLHLFECGLQQAFYNRQLISFQSLCSLSVREFGFELNCQFLLSLKNLEYFYLDTHSHLITVNLMNLAAELFKKNQNFCSFQLPNLSISTHLPCFLRRGLKINGLYFHGKTLDEIARILTVGRQ